MLVGRLASGTGLPETRVLAGDLLFLQSYLGGIVGHTWSLAVEEHFYLLLPLVLVHLTRRAGDSRKAFHVLPRLFAVLAVAVLVARCCTAMTGDYHYLRSHFPTHLRIDSLAFGVVLSYYYHYHREPFVHFVKRHDKLRLGVGLALLTPAFVCAVEQTP